MVAPELLPDSGSQNSFASDKEFYFVLKFPNLSHQLTHGPRIPLLMHRQFISSCLSCSVSFFATNSSQFFNFLAICCMIFWKSLFLNSNFPHKLIFISLSLICPSTCLMYLKSLRFNFMIDLVKCYIFTLRFPISRFNLSFSFIQFLLSWSLSPRTAESTFRSRIFWRFSLSFNECTTFVSRSLLPSWHWAKNRCRDWFSVKHCIQSPGASQPSNMITASSFVVLVKTKHWNTDGCCNFCCCFRIGRDHGEIVWAQEPRMVAGILDRQSLILRSWLLWSKKPLLDCVSNIFGNVPFEEQCNQNEVLLFLVVSEWIQKCTQDCLSSPVILFSSRFPRSSSVNDVLNMRAGRSRPIGQALPW